MRVLGIGIVVVLVAWVLCFSVTTCVDVANAKETSTLDEVVDRPPRGVVKFTDPESGDRCYYRKNTDGISCVPR